MLSQGWRPRSLSRPLSFGRVTCYSFRRPSLLSLVSGDHGAFLAAQIPWLTASNPFLSWHAWHCQLVLPENCHADCLIPHN